MVQRPRGRRRRLRQPPDVHGLVPVAAERLQRREREPSLRAALRRHPLLAHNQLLVWHNRVMKHEFMYLPTRDLGAALSLYRDTLRFDGLRPLDLAAAVDIPLRLAVVASDDASEVVWRDMRSLLADTALADAFTGALRTLATAAGAGQCSDAPGGGARPHEAHDRLSAWRVRRVGELEQRDRRAAARRLSVIASANPLRGVATTRDAERPCPHHRRARRPRRPLVRRRRDLQRRSRRRRHQGARLRRRLRPGAGRELPATHLALSGKHPRGNVDAIPRADGFAELQFARDRFHGSSPPTLPPPRPR